MNDMYRKLNKENLYLKSLDENNREDYIKKYIKYYGFLLPFLIELLDLKEYDEKFYTNETKFSPIERENMDIYQFMSSKYLKYFYLRNNLYIERLTEEEVKELERLLEVPLDKISRAFIEKTYQKVLYETSEKSETNILKNFGPETDINCYANPNSIILGFRYNIFNESDPRSLSQKDFQKDIIFSYMKYTYADKNLDVSIIEYNDFNIDPINEEQ